MSHILAEEEPRNDFIVMLDKYHKWYDKDHSVPKDNRFKPAERLWLNSCRNHQVQVAMDNNNYVYYTNMSELVFEKVRLYMQRNQKRLYKKVDWSRCAEDIIEDMYEKI